MPRRREAITRQLAQHQVNLEEAKKAFMHAQSEIKEIELTVESKKTRILKYRQQQFEVKDNDAYRALDREARNCEQDIRELEDQELVFMEQMEPLEVKAAKCKGELEKAEIQVAAEQADMDGRVGGLETDLASAKESRSQKVVGVEDSWLSRYERTFKHTGDVALVNVMGGTCGGCHMKVPPQLVNDAKKAGDITTCMYCGRILFYKE